MANEMIAEKAKTLILIDASASIGRGYDATAAWEDVKTVASIAAQKNSDTDTYIVTDQGLEPFNRKLTWSGAPSLRAANAILNTYKDQKLNVIYMTGEDHNTQPAQNFYQAFLAAGHMVNVIALGNKRSGIDTTGFSSPNGVLLQKASLRKIPSVIEAIANAVNGEIKTPEPDTRPFPVREAEKSMSTALDNRQDQLDDIRERTQDCDRKIALLKEQKQRLSAQFQLIAGECTEIKKALNGLCGKKPASGKATPKKRASKASKTLSRAARP